MINFHNENFNGKVEGRDIRKLAEMERTACLKEKKKENAFTVVSSA